MWSTTGTPGTAPHASPPGTVTSQHPRLQETSLATPAARPGIQLIPALTRVPAYIDTEVDSDNAVSRVVASVPAGPWAGRYGGHHTGDRIVRVHFGINVGRYAGQCRYQLDPRTCCRGCQTRLLQTGML